ncbi:MAG: SDR family oxidoreductase [Chitinophagaceae bacterium]|nr:SDR family oxidoreductase [Chitinophagaceae bacterium]HQV05138.1 SDR family oxidoreductase [Chitinophagaceae bacterium]
MVTLITGTSSGVGLETALLFAKNGYSVYASMRDTTKNEKLLAAAKHENFDLKIIELDVCNTASIQKAVDTVIREEGTIDILVNNAGAGFAKSTEQATDEEIQWVIQTNLLSVIRCTKAVLPIMKAQKSGHIINLSSVGGLVGQPFNELYCAAKFGVEGYTEAMATYITEPFGIHFTAIEPGGIATEFIKSATQKTLGSSGLPNDDYTPILQKYLARSQQRADSVQQPHQVAQIIWQVAQSKNPPIRIRTSAWAEALCMFKTKEDPTGHLQNQKVIEQFL